MELIFRFTTQEIETIYMNLTKNRRIWHYEKYESFFDICSLGGFVLFMFSITGQDNIYRRFER